MTWLGISEGSPRPVEILATDIDPESLERARRRVYKKSSLREVPPPLMERYFRGEGDRWRVADEAAALVEFRNINLMESPPPGPFDLVCCRYLVYTYYRGSRKRDASARLLSSLSPGGVLMIGKKEDPGPSPDLFTPLSLTPRVFFSGAGGGTRS